MNILNSKFYHYLEVFSNFVLLNILWVVMCLPIVTIFPATAALFGVVRKWVMKKDVGVFKVYFQLFRENFKQSFWIGVIWTFFLAMLAYDFYIISQIGTQWSQYVMLLIFFVGIVFLLTSVYLFPTMVHYRAKWTTIIKNSFFLSIGNLVTTIGCLLFIFVLVLFSVYFPFIYFIAGSLIAYFIYRLCHRSFEKIDRLKGEGN